MILSIVLSVILTLFIYLVVPVLLMLMKRKLSNRTIKVIIVLNGIIGWILFNMIRLATGDGLSTNVAPAFLWSSVAYWLMQKYCTKKVSTCYEQEQKEPDHYVSTQELESVEKKNKEMRNKKIIGKSNLFVLCACIVVFACGFLIGGLVVNKESRYWENEYVNMKDKHEVLTEEYNLLVDEYDMAVDTYDTLLADYNELLGEYLDIVKQKENYDDFENLSFSGIGNDIIKGINVPKGSYYIITTHRGKSNCIVYFYEDANSYGNLISNMIGNGSEVYGFHDSVRNGYINIKADGQWTITIEKAE